MKRSHIHARSKAISPTHRIHWVWIISLCLTSSGCHRYTISINNNEVFVPPQPVEETLIQDSALSACVAQTMSDQKIRDTNDLSILNCSYAGITSLEGLARYRQLTHLGLKQNDISDVSELMKLAYLQSLDISANPQITCDHIAQLRATGIKLENSYFDCE